jgi:DAK2 domain fusion protein YloV
MSALGALGDAELRAAMVAFRDALRRHQAAINKLNVYPVPDGDTGTNMALTLESVVAELAEAPDGLAEACRAISHGSLMGARGNSGVILSQLLRGLSSIVREHEAIDGAVLADALGAASAMAYEAVMKPVEGTILTVLRESAEVAGSTSRRGDGAAADLLAVLEATRDEAAASLARTPELLPVLAQAGVVDAGGAGYLLLLDVLLSIVDGRAVPEPDDEAAGADLDALSQIAHDAHGEHGHGDVSDLRYEVMYFLEAPDDTVPAFKDVWAGIGDSIVVVGGDGIWNCHIHTDDIGASIEAALDVGRPRQIRVTDLLEQVEEERWVRDAATQPAAGSSEPRPPVQTAVVAVCVGEGIARIFHSLGAQEIVTGGQTMNPSTAMLLEAVERAPSDAVVILPNNKNIVAVAEQVDDQTSKQVHVVPTHGVIEGFASLVHYDPDSPIDENGKALRAGADAVVAAEVTRAVRPSTCDLGPIAEGDYMGIARDGIRAVAPDLATAATSLLDALVQPSHELLTIVEGDGSSAADTRRITEWLAEHHPGVEPEIHHGGQPLYPYLFGLE